jgi:2'-5' RNA ligase
MAEQRLFFGLWPDPASRDRLARLAGQFQPPGGRRHHPDDLHITLVFLGQVDAARQPCIYQVADSVQASSFTLRLDTLGHWPRPRILWCGPNEVPGSLQRLVADLQQGLLACGFEPERRRYKPHVTLHRKVHHAKTDTLEQPIEWQAREFVLAASEGGAPGQSRYRILHRWPLDDSTEVAE